MGKDSEVMAPPGNRVVRFFREHWLGIGLLGLAVAFGGWITWSVRDCLTRQADQLEVTRKALIVLSTSDQKYMNDLDALITRFEIYDADKRRGMMNAEEHWEAVFKVVETINADCNTVHSARYEVAGELNQLKQLFSFSDYSFGPIVPDECKAWSVAIERWRVPGSSGLPSNIGQPSQPQDSNTATDVRAASKKIRASRMRQSEAFIALESLLELLETEGTFPRIRRCLHLKSGI